MSEAPAADEPVEEAMAGWPPGSLVVERFAPPAAPVPGTAGPATGTATGAETDGTTGPSADPGAGTPPFEVELAGSGRVITVGAGASVLAALEGAGVPVLSSCREGTCGTCEVGVLDGTVDHRDRLLTPQERAAGDTMMVCVSRSLTPRLVLDL